MNALLVVPADANAMNSTGSQIVVTDGTSGDYFIQARDGLRPEDDSNYAFDTATDRFVFGAFVDFGARAFEKFLNRGIVTTDATTTNDNIELLYQLPGGTATTIVTTSTGTDKAEAAITSEVGFTTVRYKGEFNNNNSTSSPVLTGLALVATPNPPRKRVFPFDVLIQTESQTIEGVRSLEEARELHNHIFAAKDEYCTLTDMLGNTVPVHILDVQTVSVRKRDDGLEERIAVVATEI